MKAIFSKELRQFFSSITGYVVIILYLIVNGLFLWVFPSSSIIDFGFASLSQYFTFAPWVLMFLISAVTMRMFSDEYKSGNMEILDTLPISNLQIVLGKFWASLTLIVIAILPTMVYIWSVSFLSYGDNGLDVGAMIGSYIGLILLSAAFVAIGLFGSTLSSNQIIAFLFSLVLCFFFYQALDAVSLLPSFENGSDYIIQQFGMSYHYLNINNGVLDSSDIVYFISMVVFFLFLCMYVLQSRMWEKGGVNEN